MAPLINHQSDRSHISRLWSNYIAPQKSTLIIAFIFMAILAATQAAYVYFIRYVIDFASNLGVSENASNATATFVKTVVPAIIFLTFISGFSMFAQTVLTNKVALNTVAGLQKDMSKSAHRADYAFFSRGTVGDLLSRFTNDMQAVTQALLRSLSNLFKDVLTILAVLGTMFYMAPKLSALILIVYPLAAWPIIKLSKALRGNASAAQAHMGVLTSQLDESFSGARMIKAYGLEGHETDRLDKSFKERVRLYLKLVTNQARVDPLMEVFGGLAIAGIFAVGVYLVSSGQSTGGTVAAVLGAVLILAPRLRALGTLNNVVQEGLAALGRIYAVIDETPTITNRPDAVDLSNPHGDITLEEVSFSYDETPVLNGVSIKVKSGETAALVGPSGGGNYAAQSLSSLKTSPCLMIASLPMSAAMTLSLGRMAIASRAGRNNGSPSPARSCAMRRYCCSMKPPQRSTQNRKPLYKPPLIGSGLGVLPSLSPTALAPLKQQIISMCLIRGGSLRVAPIRPYSRKKAFTRNCAKALKHHKSRK